LNDRVVGSNLTYVERKFQTVDGAPAAHTGTQAVDRAALLLRLVLESDQPLAVGTLAERAALPKSTASRLLSSLARHGLVRRAARGRGAVGPGPAILRIAYRAMVQPHLIELGREPMQVLSEASGETVNLAVPGSGGVEHIAQVDGRHFLGTGQWVGRTVPYDRTATGKVLLAHGAADQPAPSPLDGTGELERCRREGFATATDELEPGLTALAAPVRGPTGDVIAALSVAGPTLRLPTARIEELRPLLIAQARALSVRLGHDEEGGEAA
jgi:IclR family acetate operon transcriptional repressor